MALRFFLVGRERRSGDPTPLPPERERRSVNGEAAHYVGLHDPRVSRRHAEIYVLGERIYLRDLGSKNGTFVLERGRVHRITEAYVRRQQIVSFGGHLQRVANLIDGTARRRLSADEDTDPGGGSPEQ